MGQNRSEVAEALAIELRKPEPLPPLSLHRIEDELMQLIQAREDAAAEGLMPEELKVFDAEIDRYVAAEVRKVDGIAHAINGALAFAAEAQREADRLADRAKAWKARADRIKAATLYAMQMHGVRVLETSTNRLRVQANGGVAPLEVNAEVLSPEYLDVMVKMPVSEAIRLELTFNASWPSQERIREALKRGENVIGAKLGEWGVHLRCE